MRRVTFEPEVLSQFIEWATEDKKTFLRIADLLKEMQRTPFEGKGKPEPLRHDLKGFWSWRVTDEHRIVYEVRDETMTVISCKYHYQR